MQTDFYAYQYVEGTFAAKEVARFLKKSKIEFTYTRMGNGIISVFGVRVEHKRELEKIIRSLDKFRLPM